MGKDPATNLCMSFSAKPISLVERCYCRSTVSNLPRGYIRELRFIHTPNCPFQVMWVLRSTSVSDSCIESRFHSGMKPSERVSRYWTFLTINLHKMAGQRKELCAHSRPSVTFTRMVTEKVFISRPKVTFPASESLEYGEENLDFWNSIHSLCWFNNLIQTIRFHL